jgi:amidase
MESQTGDGFRPGPRDTLPPLGSGALNGLRFAIKDNIDLVGTRTGGGNPGWLREASPAASSADIVVSLQHAGAAVAGKTITEELAFSLIGNNAHYPVPRNPPTPGRFAGGSSSGSATVVAAGLVDFALGTDTAGSVRVPASNCGLFGIRPTQSSLSMQGIMALAPTMDTPGWLARDAGTVKSVGDVLFEGLSQNDGRGREPRIGTLQAALTISGARYAAGLRRACRRIASDEEYDIPESRISADYLARAAEALRVLQAAEAWAIYGKWVTNTPADKMTPDVRARVLAGKELSTAEIAKATEVRRQLCFAMAEELCNVDYVIMPTVVEPAPRLSATANALARYRSRTVCVTCISSLTGTPELTVPAVSEADYRMGISVIGRAGSDRALLAFAEPAA